MAKINKPTTTLFLDTRYQKKDGTFPYKLRITYRGKPQLYPTNIDMSLNDYQKLNGKKPRQKFQDIKRRAEELKYRADDIIQKMGDFTFPAFDSLFLKPKNLTTDLATLFKNYIKKLEDSGMAIGTIKLYESSINSINKFRTGCRVTDITVDWLIQYQNFMLNEQNNSVTILAIYLRNLRAVINMAIHVDKVMSKEVYPFGKYLYQIPTGNNDKQALALNQVEAIFEYKGHQPEAGDSFLTKKRKLNIGRARAFFCLSYLGNGINFKDIGLLKNNSIENNKIIYYRAKTASRRKKIQAIKIEMTTPMKRIIEKYRVKDSSPDAYLFDIFKPGMTQKQIRTTIQQFTKTTNKYLAVIAKDLNIPVFTTYAARHSFATILRNKGASTEYIQEALGHEDFETTKNYLAGFPDEMKKKWAESLINFKKAS